MLFPIIIEAVAIRRDEQGLFCINDLHKASGNNPRHKPANWLRLEQTKELIAVLDESLKNKSDAHNRASEQNQSVKVVKGSDGWQGTFIHKKLVYAYAMWISPHFHLKVIDVFDEVVTQAFETANTWDQTRQASKKMRKKFTGTLAEHEVKGFGFAQCTDGIYRPLFGAKASQLKQQKGLTKKDSLRDAMNEEELIASAFAEMVASQRIDANDDRGNSPCYTTCKKSGQDVRGLLVKQLS